MIVKDIDSICINNGIDYYLLGGSAIGAIRHQGFIPWDDDLDIIMDNYNYSKFVQACRSQLDFNKYYFQERFIDWPMPFSKIRLRGTTFSEPGEFVNPRGESGIFIDIFTMENASSSRFQRCVQYIFGKYFLCYCLYKRGWKGASFLKKTMMALSAPLNNSFLRSFVVKQVTKYNELPDAKFYFFYSGRYRLRNSFFKKSLFSSALRVKFEDTYLPVPIGYDEWLKLVFGDYMTPPPLDTQVSLHLLDVDFGSY